MGIAATIEKVNQSFRTWHLIGAGSGSQFSHLRSSLSLIFSVLVPKLLLTPVPFGPRETMQSPAIMGGGMTEEVERLAKKILSELHQSIFPRQPN